MIQAERIWKWVATRDYFAGNFIWTGFDYLGESTWPFRGFASGSLDLVGHPKEGFYLYQSLWTDRPMLHLFPHWTWAGREGQTIPVLAFSNCSAVELFLNGRPLGEKRREFPAQGTSGGWDTYAEPRVHPTTGDLHLSWDVPYEPGVLRAVGRRRDGQVACQDEVRTAGRPVALRLVADRDTVTTGLGDVALVTFEVLDSAGTVVPTANDAVQVTVTGGRILALDNADLRDLDPYHSGRRRVSMGRGLAVVRAAMPGSLTITATAPGLRPATLTATVTAGPPVGVIPAAR
jgi:beta-galactosidase